MLKIILWCWCLLISSILYAQPIKVATSDWAVAETLQAMGHAPVAVGDKKAYQYWVGKPSLSDMTLDSGVRLQPNMELLWQVKPQIFINTPFYNSIATQLESIAPVHQVQLMGTQGYNWITLSQGVRDIGVLVHDSVAAETLIQQTITSLQHNKQRLIGHKKIDRPILMVQFVDNRHLRVYARNSLYQLVLDQLGLQNAWQYNGNVWGSETIPLTALNTLPADTLLIIIQPYPKYIIRQIQNSALWQRLPMMQNGHYLILAPSWSFGSMPSMVRFGQQLTDALLKGQGEQW